MVLGPALKERHSIPSRDLQCAIQLRALFKVVMHLFLSVELLICTSFSFEESI